MKLLLLSLLILSIGITAPLTPAFAHDEIFEYRKCLFNGQFWNLFCPSNPDNYKGAGLCLVYDQNCIFVRDDSLLQPPIKCIQMNANQTLCYESVKPAPPNCIWIDEYNRICTHYKP